ncbi:uncharacterized protein LOC121996403 isoform X1 [Zingiber officinale]|uniref:uncharacterized protein LOC121996403 isoform X1 n=1 Tax=Zingiber officinale TaxID=94328 RepID=UPI001C4C2CEE|nr:uncharacterized protein LOC121996403 isoform X1 [Zingiber officinale]
MVDLSPLISCRSDLVARPSPAKELGESNLKPNTIAPNLTAPTATEIDRSIDRASDPSTMAAPTPPATHIDPSAAAAAVVAAATPRKLPIKRKDPLNPPSDHPLVKPDDDDEDLPDPDPSFDDDDDDFDEAEEVNAARPPAAGSAVLPPFRFQRVWSESDEIRFLQGLLGCWSQGLVFPRDLNLFFDRFSESMPQPYTRSQLSEKLRRLRKKFRVMSARIARGQDPSRLSPHDRDVLHLCTRLWHPTYAASSPFSSPDTLAPGSRGNKRRRPNPRAPSGQARAEASPVTAPSPPPPPPLLGPVFTLPTTATPSPVPISTLPPPVAQHPPLTNEKVAFPTDGISASTVLHFVKEEKEPKENEPIKEENNLEPPPVSGSNEASAVKDMLNPSIAKTVLDVFDACLEELKLSMASSISSSTTKESNLEKKWRELRAAEMNVLARRLREEGIYFSPNRTEIEGDEV